MACGGCLDALAMITLGNVREPLDFCIRGSPLATSALLYIINTQGHRGELPNVHLHRFRCDVVSIVLFLQALRSATWASRPAR